MTQLLVSVRSPEEAEAALAGGADLIDIKEPAHGALGRADDATIAAIVHQVANRKPVSAAVGELRDSPQLPPNFDGLAKIGLAGCDNPCASAPLREMLGISCRRAQAQGKLVPVAYADWEQAKAPRPRAVVDLAIAIGATTFLIDTFTKEGRNLLDWLPLPSIQELRDACRAAGMRLALAGSLQEGQVLELLPLEPDVIAVRGAACHSGRRGAEVDSHAVERLADLVHGKSRKLSSTISVEESSLASFGNHLSTTP